MSLVSIVIPAFNQGPFVAAAIESALGQSYPWLEVIVVNDGSTDGTADALAKFRGVPNVTIVDQANGGLPAARNRGLDEVSGEFVCFLDSDDLLTPTYVERLLEPLDSDPSLDFAYCDIQTVDRDGAPSDDYSVGSARRILSGDIFDSLLMGGYFPPHAVLVRRRTLDTYGAFDIMLGGNADYELWLRLSASGALAHYVDDRLVRYRVYPGTMSRDLDGMRTTRFEALERISQAFPERMAVGLGRVQELANDLYAANTWLRARWDETIGAIERKTGLKQWTVIDRFGDLTLVTGAAEQLALWDVSTADGCDRCVFLHPPAAIELRLPTGAAGRFVMDVSLHPDVWTKTEAGGSVFTATIDDAIVGAVLLDPARRTADRRWVQIELDVPASPRDEHVLRLETQAVHGGAHVWALFRDATFTADAA